MLAFMTIMQEKTFKSRKYPTLCKKLIKFDVTKLQLRKEKMGGRYTKCRCESDLKKNCMNFQEKKLFCCLCAVESK